MAVFADDVLHSQKKKHARDKQNEQTGSKRNKLLLIPYTYRFVDPGESRLVKVAPWTRTHQPRAAFRLRDRRARARERRGAMCTVRAVGKGPC